MKTRTIKTYLALGDSYTIGEQVPLYESFPYQALQLLRKKVKNLSAPEIIAKTGWTTDELLSALAATTLLQQYDIVSLLIGVNNQYRGRDVENFKVEFTILLKKAIGYAANHNHVFVLSIPDWGVTPFAEARDRTKIAAEIDAYNNVCRLVAQENNVQFIDITPSQRADASAAFTAADGLHPSGKEYAKWARLLADDVLAKGL